ncbi:2-hydroxyacid dehydrogenase [Neomegalonema perideroedes]|uniref:2-hydroxyacid dehydrogenase n=1 Tax=Neomegalonema perideroedes TaxID=217219 RepID=UPI000361D051|nr:glyoxylate/hydroxypyruvate reductase A [Neomegalonema perideroedes]
MRVLYAGDPEEKALWEGALRAADPQMDLIMEPGQADPASVEALLYAPSGPLRDVAPYRNLRFIQSLWAGVERILGEGRLPAGVPLARMVEPGLERGMVEYMLGHGLRIHLETERFREAQARELWAPQAPPLASGRPVGVLGLGELGAAVARALAGVGFPVSGWSRSPKPGIGAEIRALSGPEGLEEILKSSEILMVLLPLTPETRGLLNARTLALLPRGAQIVNAARGPILEEEALLAALESGALGGATLDVFAVEPLPPGHPFWRHPRILVTPHVASATRPETAAQVVAAQMRRLARGERPLHLVDRGRGY